MTEQTYKTIRLHNTKTRTTEIFKPINEGAVGIYSCGPTVYHFAHIGNLRAYVFADVLRRVFVDVGHLVGDGDDGQDKLEKGAAREGKNVWEIAKLYTDAYFQDLENLNIPLNAYVFPRATDHIREQIGLISALDIEGFTYKISDGIYFDTSKFKNYATFAHLDIEGLQSGARVEENKEKRNITDFALWKFSPSHEQRQMEWDSPWGKGFPGWHIECSAMAMKYLGNHFDIHTGGIDHIPVHHTNEIAQSECVTGETYVNYWMHVNFLNDMTGKMSKSNDDFLTLSLLQEKGYSSIAYRYFLLTAHYRKELSFSFESLEAASVAYKKLMSWASLHTTTSGSIIDSYKQLFNEALYDDLNTPQAVAVIWTMIKDITLSSDDVYRTLMYMNQVLGLTLDTSIKTEATIPDNVQVLVEARNTARTEKNWSESDNLRNKINVLGFDVKDTDNGQEITKK
jgi:cysteinyl-tRNA synthetase